MDGIVIQGILELGLQLSALANATSDSPGTLKQSLTTYQLNDSPKPSRVGFDAIRGEGRMWSPEPVGS